MDDIIEVICQLWFHLERQVACCAACASAAHGHSVHLPALFCRPVSRDLLQPAAHMPLHWPALTGLAAACSTLLWPAVTGCVLLQWDCPLWCDHHRADMVIVQGGRWSYAHLASHRLGQHRPSTAGSCVIHHEQGMGGPGQGPPRVPIRSGESHASQCIVEVHVPPFRVTAKLLAGLWLDQHPYCASCRWQTNPCAGHVAGSPCRQSCQS